KIVHPRAADLKRLVVAVRIGRGRLLAVRSRAPSLQTGSKETLMRAAAVIVLGVIGLAACGGSPPPPAEPPAADTSSLEAKSGSSKESTDDTASSAASSAPAAAFPPAPSATGTIDGKPFSPKVAQVIGPMKKDGRITLSLTEATDC